MPPHALHLDLCCAEEASAIASCFIEATQWSGLVSATCSACAVSGAASATSAALIVSANKVEALNVAGCVAAASGNPTETDCGPKLEAKQACLAAACAACKGMELAACAVTAESTVCAAPTADARCADLTSPSASGARLRSNARST